jgi:hypothetical protein
MYSINLERMIQFAAEVFDVKNGMKQLAINPNVMDHLKKLHPATISEHTNENGPVCRVLVIPTTTLLMNRFLENKISEKELFRLTEVGMKYDAIYPIIL